MSRIVILFSTYYLDKPNPNLGSDLLFNRVNCSLNKVTSNEFFGFLANNDSLKERMKSYFGDDSDMSIEVLNSINEDDEILDFDPEDFFLHEYFTFTSLLSPLFCRFIIYSLSNIAINEKDDIACYAVWCLPENNGVNPTEWRNALLQEVIERDSECEEIILMLHDKDYDCNVNFKTICYKETLSGKSQTFTVALFSHISDDQTVADLLLHTRSKRGIYELIDLLIKKDILDRWTDKNDDLLLKVLSELNVRQTDYKTIKSKRDELERKIIEKFQLPLELI